MRRFPRVPVPIRKGIQFGNGRLHQWGRQGFVLPMGSILSEVDPTQLAKLVPFHNGADIR